jgi:hypothetical protein
MVSQHDAPPQALLDCVMKTMTICAQPAQQVDEHIIIRKMGTSLQERSRTAGKIPGLSRG